MRKDGIFWFSVLNLFNSDGLQITASGFCISILENGITDSVPPGLGKGGYKMNNFNEHPEYFAVPMGREFGSKEEDTKSSIGLPTLLWETRDGQALFPYEMTTRHLENTIRYIDRRLPILEKAYMESIDGTVSFEAEMEFLREEFLYRHHIWYLKKARVEMMFELIRRGVESGWKELYKPVIPFWVAKVLEKEKQQVPNPEIPYAKEWREWKKRYSRKLKYARLNGWIVEEDLEGF